MNFTGLILWILMGYLMASMALELGWDASLAVLVGCLTTSLLQRLYTVSGKWKGTK